MKNKKKLTLNNQTEASNPGDVTFDPLNWFKYDKKKILSLKFQLLVPTYLTFMQNYWFFAFALAMLFFNVYYWISKKEHFEADSNPGVIISTNPPLAAVYTNLAKYDGDFPVVKIIEYKVKKPINIGDIIATVAVYSAMDGDQEHDYEYWEDFYPLPAEYATKDAAEVRGAINTYSEEAFCKLELAVSEITEPRVLGLTRVHVNTSDWKHVS